MTALWVALTLAAPVAAREVQRRLGPRVAGWEAELAFWARIAYGVLPLSLAWITGAVFAWDCGIVGFTAAEWLVGLGMCGLILAAFAVSLRTEHVRELAATWFGPGGSWLDLLDEPRWAFYRGAAAVAFPNPAAFQAIGFALGGLEWTIRNGRPSRGTPPRAWSGIARLAVSALLFALTRNLWLILLTQAAAQALLLRATSNRKASA